MAKKRMSKAQRKKTLVGGVAVIGLVAVILIAGWATGLISINPGPDPVEAPTTITFSVLDQYNSEEWDGDDHEIYIYHVDVSDLEQEEIDDLTYADYSLDTTKDSGESYTPDADYLYYCKINGSDAVEDWFIPTLGINTRYVVNATEDVYMVASSSDEGSTTLTNTSYDEWEIKVQTLDAAEGTGSKTNKEGFKSYYDFEDDKDHCIILRIEFNSTAALAYCDFESSQVVTESAAGVYLYYEIDGLLMGEDVYEIDFGTAITGGTVGVVGAAVGYGTAASNTLWDTQA